VLYNSAIRDFSRGGDTFCNRQNTRTKSI
jgi:hypothetical protein